MGVPLQVLLVEDSESDALLVLRELRQGGYEVTHRRVDSEAAMRDALEHRWDLVVGDFSMPGFSGAAALSLLRERDEDVPFIFVSGTIGEDVAVAAMKAGANDYVVKGRLARLVPAVQRELRDAETRRERARAQDALHRSEERFSRVFRASPAGIAISLVASGIYLDVNDAFLSLGGFARDEVVGRSAMEVGVWADPADRSALIAELRGSAVHGRELAVRTRSGDRRAVLASFELIELGGQECLLSILVDVHALRQLEAQLRQAQKMEAVGRMAAAIAHDFNNMLTVITGSCGLLLEDLPPVADAREQVTLIGQAVDGATALTRQLLAFSRGQVLEPRVLDLNAVVAGVEAILRRLVGASIHVEVAAQRGLGMVYADEGQLQQVLMNLAANARDAMPNGGRLTIATAERDLLPGAAGAPDSTPPGRYVALTVSDTGSGMSVETLAHIFEPFFTTKGAGAGTGLGLATVYGIVRQSNGFLEVDSAPGSGTSFRIHLPRVDRPAEPVRGGSDAPHDLRGTETVLLVEDSEPLRRVVAGSLARFGYTVLVAADARQALRIEADHPGAIELLLSDVMLPEMNGPELADLLLARRPAMKTLFVSGYASEAVLRHGSGSLAAYLQKPFTIEDLVRRVRDVLTGAG